MNQEDIFESALRRHEETIKKSAEEILPDVRRAAELIDRIRESPAVEIVRTSDALLEGATNLYRQRLDKRYSLADCLAMVICHDRGVTEILSTDRDFEAEGFTILLKR